MCETWLIGMGPGQSILYLLLVGFTFGLGAAVVLLEWRP